MRDFIRASRFYPGLLVVVIVSISAICLGRAIYLSKSTIETTASFPFWTPTNAFGMAIAAVSLLILAWRICFALRYRPYAPVPDSKLPAVSVVIPAYNEGAQILPTIRSVIASNYPAKKLQVICVDDGSRDDTWNWMETAQKEFPGRVHLIRQPVNGGKRKALLAGIGQATGKVLVTIDSDSEVLPDTLNQLVCPFVKDSHIGAVAGNVRVLNLAAGAIPKMLEVSFTNAFDFIRSGQSVYGGVFCTPGALSAYRMQVIQSSLKDWGAQTFMGKPATIGEDRAMTNLVLAAGYRVVYQREAMVLTKVPETLSGLWRMLLRWARSNVRENLVMLSYVLRRFRSNNSGAGWIRLFSFSQLMRMTIIEALKCAILVELVIVPTDALLALSIGTISAALLPAVVYRLRYGTWFGFRWALPFSVFWVFCLSWISLWGLFTASNSGWLTRGSQSSVPGTEMPAGSAPRTASNGFRKAA